LAKAVIKSTFNKINKDLNNWFIVALWFGLFLCFATLSTKAIANDFNATLSGNNNSLNIVQDGVDNVIDLTPNNFSGATMEIKQNGNDNKVDLNISGGTGTGSSFYIYQNGNNLDYTSTLFCGAAWCTMTVNQN